MWHRILDRLSLSIELLALAAAAAITLVGGWRGSFAGIELSARSADRPLYVFSVLFLLRSWLGTSGAVETRAIGTLWKAVVGMAAPTKARRAAWRPVMTAVAVWAVLGASVGLAEDAGLIAGHRYLFTRSSAALLSLACGAAIYAAAAGIAAPAAVLAAGLVSRTPLLSLLKRLAAGQNFPSASAEDGSIAAPRARAVGEEDARRSLALFPLVATWTLAGWRPIWSLPPGGPAGLAQVLTLAVSPLVFAGFLPAAARRAAHMPALSLAAVLASSALAAFLIVGAGPLTSLTPGPAQAGLAAPNAWPASLPPPPNILLVTIDTLRADRLGCYGNDHVRTPRLDALAASGVRCDQVVCQIPETGPSHASILSGLYPQTHGSRTNGERLPDLVSFPVILHGLGYRSAAFVSGYPLKARLAGLDRGFDLYDDSFSSFETLPGLTLVSRLERLGLFSYVDLWEIWAERRADATNSAIFHWLRETAAEASPFFLWVHYYDPHGPYDPPPPYSRMYYRGNERDPKNHSMDRVVIPHRHQEKPGVTDVNFYIAQYDGEVSWTDSQLGALLDELAARGLASRTIVVVTADHGESLTEHEYWFAHGDFLYDSSIRVPLIFAGTGIAKGRVFGGQAQSVDIVPTLLDLLGLTATTKALEKPYTMDGRSLAPILWEGRGSALVPEDLPPAEAFIETNVIHARNGRHYGDPVAAKARAIRLPGFKLIVTPGFGDALYDLAADPGETKDVSLAHAEIAAGMGGKLTRWIASAPATTERGPLPAGERELLESLGYVGR